MNIVDTITNYLIDNYHPVAMIVYGSYADGTANENSDFDALVIADHEKTHDSSIVENTVLDVFVYPLSLFQSEFDIEEFVQIFDGKILMDKDGIAKQLQKRVLDHIAQAPRKATAEIRQEIRWCEKMLLRASRDDEEGFYRWHWVLVDSLEIYHDIKGQRYFGPKKGLRFMAETDEAAFRLYSRALKDLDRDSLSEWISYLKRMSETT